MRSLRVACHVTFTWICGKPPIDWYVANVTYGISRFIITRDGRYRVIKWARCVFTLFFVCRFCTLDADCFAAWWYVLCCLLITCQGNYSGQKDVDERCVLCLLSLAQSMNCLFWCSYHLRTHTPVSLSVLTWCYVIQSVIVHVNTRAKGNPMKAVRKGSIILRFERPTSLQSAKSNWKTRCFQRSHS